MTMRAATSSPAVDAASALSRHATAPVRASRSDPSPRVFADMQRDAVVLTWDMTVHQLHQPFARCLALPSTKLLDARASQEVARTRLAPARYAVDGIQAALSRMVCGTYGRCQQCGCRIAADRLQASPAARWCAACQV